jgi:hypothetical protein
MVDLMVCSRLPSSLRLCSQSSLHLAFPFSVSHSPLILQCGVPPPLNSFSFSSLLASIEFYLLRLIPKTISLYINFDFYLLSTLRSTSPHARF